MNKISDELLKQRRRALYASKRKKWLLSRMGAKSAGISGLSVTVQKAASQSTPTNASPINFTVQFSSAVTGFTAPADLSFTGSTVGGTLSGTITGGPIAFNVAVTGMTGQGNVNLTIPAAAALNTATGLLSNTISNTGTVAYDSIAPTVTINKAVGQADPTSTTPITFTVVFSEAVTGFLASDVVFTGTTAGTLTASLSGTGPTYSIEVTGMSVTGNAVASIPASVCTDLAGNANTISTSTDNAVAWVQPDVIAPTVTINKDAGQADPTSTSPILFTVTFSETVTGFTNADVSFTGSTVGGTLSASVSGSGTTYTVTVTGMTTDGNVIASIPAGSAIDSSSNLSLASTSTDNIVAWVQPSTAAPTYFIYGF